jgi:hypothetical protein
VIVNKIISFLFIIKILASSIQYNDGGTTDIPATPTPTQYIYNLLIQLADQTLLSMDDHLPIRVFQSFIIVMAYE